MGDFVKREIYFLIKNPITYISIFLMVVIVAVTVGAAHGPSSFQKNAPVAIIQICQDVSVPARK